MKKPSKEKFNALLCAARELFMKHGFRRVSIEEICMKADVSKMTFYKNFRNKEEIMVSVLDGIYAAALARFNEVMAENTPFHERMRQWVDLKKEMSKEFGKEFIDELICRGDTPVTRYITQKRGEVMGLARDIYTRAQEQGQIRSDIRIELIMHILDLYSENLFNDRGLLSLFRNSTDLADQLYTMLFFGIVPRQHGQ